jgi:hypothetical protein
VANTPVYKPRLPRSSSLWLCLWTHFNAFLQNYAQRQQRKYGFLRPIVEEVIGKFLECGDLSKGFARIRCPDCSHEMLLSFSCKSRWFCPSCHQKKTQLFGEFVYEEVCFPVPHRQFVFTLPKMFRPYFRYDRDLLKKLCLAVRESLRLYFREHLSLPEGEVGLVMVIHTFGDYLNFHPHIHVLTADGLFRDSGLFHVCPEKGGLSALSAIFRDQVLKFLIQEGRTEVEFAEKLRSWKHSGFGVYRGERIAADDRKGLENLARYIVRNPFSLEKITYNEDTGTVIYRSKHNHNTKRNFEVFAAEDFIGAITQHIPDKFFQNIRYYGWYSNKSRGQRKQAEDEAEASGQKADAGEVIDVREHQPRRIPSKHWRELIKKVWEVDPLCCPKCQAEMKVVALIDCPNLIRHILEHLNLWEPVNRMIRPRAPPIQEMPEAHLLPGDWEQYALPLHRAEAMEGVDEIPPDDVPTIVYA